MECIIERVSPGRMTSEEAIARWAEGKKGVWDQLSPSQSETLIHCYINTGATLKPLSSFPRDVQTEIVTAVLILRAAWREQFNVHQNGVRIIPRPTYDSSEIVNSLDITRLYFMDISQIPLLCSTGEVELSKCIWAARTEDLVDTEAERELVEANQRLVISIAKHYKSITLTLLDRIGEGNLGLMEATVKFDYRRNLKFSTFATPLINQAIIKAIAKQDRTIKIPVKKIELTHQLDKAVEQYLKIYGCQPTDDELSVVLEIPTDKVKQIHRAKRMQPISLYARVGSEDEEFQIDRIGDEKQDPEAEVIHDLQGEIIPNLFDSLVAQKKLSARNRSVIELRFGITDGKAHTLEEVGQEFGLTRERIRQIESAVLKQCLIAGRQGGLDEWLD